MRQPYSHRPISQVSILGVGLLGGSIGLAIQSQISNCKIVGYGHRRSTLDQALVMGAITEAHQNLSEAVAGSDLVILCTPVGLFEKLLKEMAPVLRPGTLVTDVGSTKRSVTAAAESILSDGVFFVGSHPIAGSEKRGVEFARADLFQNALCITTPTPRTDMQALAAMEEFWRKIGMRIDRLSPEDHDRLLADVSHLPHALAAALVAMQADEGLALAGKGFLDTTRIAGGDAELWRDIFHDNRDYLLDAVRRLEAQLREFTRLLEPAHADRLTAWLAAAAARRDRMRQNPSSRKMD